MVIFLALGLAHDEVQALVEPAPRLANNGENAGSSVQSLHIVHIPHIFLLFVCRDWMDQMQVMTVVLDDEAEGGLINHCTVLMLN